MNTQQKIITGLLALGLGFGCGGQTQQQGETKAPEPTVTKQKVGNISAVDLAVCFPKAPALPDRIDVSVLSGLLSSARPLVMECLVDPKNRGAADATEFTVESTLEGGKLTHKLSGTNLTPDGEKCIGGAIDKFIASSTEWPAKATATTTKVVAKMPFQHNAAAMPSVKMGLNEFSDVTGAIRLAEAGFCDCYAPWKEAEPPVLKASVKIKKGAAPTVTFDPTTDANATQVAACLQPKLAALPYKTTSDELTAPYTFAFANSMGTGMFTNATPDMAFVQYEAVRTQYFGVRLIAEGGHAMAFEGYAGLVQKYKKDPKSVTIPQLQAACDALEKSDGVYIAALEKLLGIEEKGVAMLTEFTAKDASWAPVKDGTVQHAAQSKKELENAKAAKAEDAVTCGNLRR